ncbi:ketosamine-3-kinase-like [Halichondria panicea]|uniref:ketosamine-3-kinase-like n=1 Tax=Halichondria panicea TaxID=6063 RepID=UPI00312B2F30
MEEVLRTSLHTTTLTARGGVAAGGCISNGRSYQTDNGTVFIKHNTKPETRSMFEGEYASLDALYSTHTVTVPKPIKVFPDGSGSGWFFAMEHLEMTGRSKYQESLGEQLAKLHLHNISLRGTDAFVSEFGFPCPTSCGLIPMPNHWTHSWIEFYITKRLEPQVALTEGGGETEARILLDKLKQKIPAMFEGLEVVPSLLHGDLWSGNFDETDDYPVVFDPASFYGHHEFDLAITRMFGGFDGKFYDAYHKLIPKSPGFATRHKLYILFHYLNHWNHFGGGYRSQAISLLQELSL